QLDRHLRICEGDVRNCCSLQSGHTVIAPLAGLATYMIKRRRRFKFAELGVLLDKMKQGGATSEDGLHLMDAMHQARKVVKKRKLDSAFEYAVLAFILVGLFGQNAGIGLLAG